MHSIDIDEETLLQEKENLAALLAGEAEEAWQCIRVTDATVQPYVYQQSSRLLLYVPRDTMGICALFLEAGDAHDIRVLVPAGATLTVIVLQRGIAPVSLTQHARVAEGGSMTWHNVTLGAHVEQTLVSTLAGAHARSTVDWLFYARGAEQQRLRARNVFTARAGGGEITLQGVAEHKAHVTCEGLIAIGAGGGGTETYLTESVLMLDATAKVDAVPGLEIKTNDVKASHSAVVSRVTEENLFTFAARGIPEDEARRMFIAGYLGTMIDRIALPDLREQLRATVLAKENQGSFLPEDM